MKTNPNDPASPAEFLPEGYAMFINGIGLTKREHFASVALKGILSADSTYSYEFAAKESVLYADALIAALNETSTSKP